VVSRAGRRLGFRRVRPGPRDDLEEGRRDGREHGRHLLCLDEPSGGLGKEDHTNSENETPNELDADGELP